MRLSVSIAMLFKEVSSCDPNEKLLDIQVPLSLMLNGLILTRKKVIILIGLNEQEMRCKYMLMVQKHFKKIVCMC